MDAEPRLPGTTLEIAFRLRLDQSAFDVAFAAPGRGVTALFGPSGAGKSTIVAVLAGLLRPERQQVIVAGRVLADSRAGVSVPAERRRVGLVFQDSRLFPHMRVEANLRYGERRAPGGPRAAAIGFDDAVDLLGIGALLNRRPHTLSGGERQRVAIGRALLSHPSVLALDEPLASLDADRKAEILPYLARLRTLDLPILYVSHDLAEVAALADTLVLIEAGRVRAAGPLTALAARGDLPLAARDDAAAIVEATVVRHDGARRLTEVAANGRPILVPQRPEPPGARLRLRVPARDVALAAPSGVVPDAISVQNVLAGTVGSVTPQSGHAATVEVRLDGGGLLARVTRDAVDRLSLVPGASVLALIKSVSIEVLG